MSWSEGRDKSSQQPSPEVLKGKLRQVDAVLEMFARDDDLQDDLKMREVKRAIKHWTGEVRLPTEEALALQDHRRVVYVLQRLQILQQVCREAGIKVPLDLMINGSRKLPDSFVATILGSKSTDATNVSAKPTNPSTNESKKTVVDSKQKQAAPVVAPAVTGEQSTMLEKTKTDNTQTVSDATVKNASPTDKKIDPSKHLDSPPAVKKEQEQAASNPMVTQLLFSAIFALIAAMFTFFMIKK
jgi:hypothetical protein